MDERPTRDGREQDERLVERNPERQRPADSARDSPAAGRIFPQLPLRSERHEQKHDEQRLVIRPAQGGAMDENGAECVDQQRPRPAERGKTARPPVEKPAAEESEERRDHGAGQVERLRAEGPQACRQGHDQVIQRRGRVRSRRPSCVRSARPAAFR